MSWLCVCSWTVLALAAQPAPTINPFPRQEIPEVTVAEWQFDRGAEGWAAEHACEVTAADGLLKIRNTGHDPYFHRALRIPGGELILRMRAKGGTSGPAEIFWTTDRSPARGNDKHRTFPLQDDGQWHEYAVEFSAPGVLSDLRIDPGSGPGELEIDWIRLVRRRWHPLSIEAVQVTPQSVRFVARNHEEAPRSFVVAGAKHSVAGQGTVTIEQPMARKTPLETVRVEVRLEPSGPQDADAKDLPPVSRTTFVFHPDVQGDWIARPLGDCTVEAARDGSVARVRRGETIVAVLAPLVHRNGRIPALKLVRTEPSIRWEGERVILELATSGKEIAIAITSNKPCEGPVVRALGGLKQGLFAGLEYLGAGEASSSTLDIETHEHLRYAPDPLKVTMPLMSFVTDRAAVAMTWKDMSLQPIFATPNFFDGTDDHRMALQGTRIEATVLIDRVPVEETIFWAVKKQGLPPLPPEPRTRQQQWDLCLKALNGPLKTEAGWGHCADPGWGRAPHADMASTIWRLTGKIPELPRLVPGGAHVANDSIYFVTGRAAEWKKIHQAQAQAEIRQQQPDGSYRYDGPMARGHFENTASGICARPAMVLLQYAWATGDKEALAAGCRTLDYMKRFDVPRGAQTWEVPLHTPDQLASAYAVWAYVRGYELTGKKDYLAEARRWALSGVPFTYLWTRYPVMLYSTPPVFGATHWKHNWIGLPVQWVGGVYAYALTLLAPHDKSLDWNHLARGILISAEQQQYPDGHWVGLLPDSFVLATQTRNPVRINPCALVSLRMVLDGQLDSLAVAFDGKHRVTAPFPVTIQQAQARIHAPKGLAYQVLVDGNVVDVPAQANQTVRLE